MSTLARHSIRMWKGNGLGRVYGLNRRPMKPFPIRTINFDDPDDVARHDKMVKLVERMLKLHKDLPDAKTPGEETRIQRQIDATDREIDRLVYELYGLSEEEIGIVEGEG